MAGPCLCGDTYCPNCGNPAEAAYADWQESLCEKLDQAKLSQDETAFLDGLLFAALEEYRKAKKVAVTEAVAGSGEYIWALEQEIARLKES